MDPQLIATGAVWYVVFLFSLTCHEAAHALVAKWGGDPTAARGGQVTLNPIPHMQREVFGTIIVPIASYALGGWMIGWASAPYDPLWRDRHPRRAAWMAVAGPTANLCLMLLAVLLIRLLMLAGVLTPPEIIRFDHVVGAASPGLAEGVAFFLSVLFSLNLLLAIFNLLPLPPLDGHAALGLVLPENASRRFAALTRNPTLAIVGLVLCWKVFPYIFGPIFGLSLALIYLGVVS
ncbi:MAG TPA: site-2 protease family protein [Terriglobia bacterium]|nr:site-2 protease family protein [Terriglobia bacterium]